MRARLLKTTVAMGVLLLLFIGVSMAVTSEENLAPMNVTNYPAVAVVDKRGVGQTQKESRVGMNERAVYDDNNKMLYWSIGKDYQLTEGYTYYITFTVEDGTVKGSECRVLKQ